MRRGAKCGASIPLKPKEGLNGAPSDEVGCLLETAEAFYGGDEIVGAGEGLGIASECVALAVDEAGHAVEHSG